LSAVPLRSRIVFIRVARRLRSNGLRGRLESGVATRFAGSATALQDPASPQIL
jgi:hypothetical protein